MRENKAKHAVEVREFNEFLRENGAVEHFVHILGVAIGEGKLFKNFTFCRKIVLLRRATAF